jgi:hypothetical protein
MVAKFRDEFERAIEQARRAAPGPLDESHVDTAPTPLGVGA